MLAGRMDRGALIFARTKLHTPAVERAVASYSRLGEHAACWIALGLVGSAVDRARRRAWLDGVATVVIAYGANQTLKFVVRRPRPELSGLPPLTPVVTKLSFPSAHATTSFAAARAYKGLVASAALYGAAGAFGVSRPYLGVHYPSDVLTGALLGDAIARLRLRRRATAPAPR